MGRGPDIETSVAFGVGPIDIDIEMARANGWTQAQLDAAVLAIGAVSREISYQVACSRGHTYKCLVCECWTVQPPTPCHLCHADEVAAAAKVRTFLTAADELAWRFDAAFHATWKRMALDGITSAPGGTEYLRVRAEWYAAGRPDLEPFIRTRTNAGPP